MNGEVAPFQTAHLAISTLSYGSLSLTSDCPDVKDDEYSLLVRTSLHNRGVPQLRGVCYNQVEVCPIILTSTTFHLNVY